ncbi:MAG: hypothetical protein GX453_06545 [Lactococcus chungangensis]|uniref:Uncharacterized protein n=1 Tax=Pseudolactococcus chungangensis TaxID=451457 RepID=A0A847J1K8_9LACT|nr:hypothetical protein [Lactococcus chungangensis]
MKNSKQNYSIIFEKIEEAKEKKEYVEKDQVVVIKEIADEIALMKEYYNSNIGAQDPISYTRT